MNEKMAKQIAETKFAAPAKCGQLVVRGFMGQVVVKTCACGVKATTPEELELMAETLLNGARKLRAQREKRNGSSNGT